MERWVRSKIASISSSCAWSLATASASTWPKAEIEKEQKTVVLYLWQFELWFKKAEQKTCVFRCASISSTYPSMSVRPLVILLNFHSISVSGRSTWKVEERRPQLFFNFGSGVHYSGLTSLTYVLYHQSPPTDQPWLPLFACLPWNIAIKDTPAQSLRAKDLSYF